MIRTLTQQLIKTILSIWRMRKISAREKKIY